MRGLSPSRVAVARLRRLRLAARARRARLRGPLIRRLILMLQSRCALRCRMCDLWLAPESSLPADRLPDLILARCVASDAGIHLTGGEPFLYPGFPEVYRRIRALAPRSEMSIQSSGAPAEAVLGFLRSLPDLRRTTLCFSFDGVGTHDGQRGEPGAEARLMRLLEEVRGIAPDAGVALKFTITPWNAGSVRPTFARARALGLGVQFHRVDDLPEYTNSVRRPKEGAPFPFPPLVIERLKADLRGVFNELSVRRGADRHEMGHLLGLIEELDGRGARARPGFCPVPSQSAFIRADGAVLACRGRPPVGNALREGLDAAWESEAARRLRSLGCGACERRYGEF